MKYISLRMLKDFRNVAKKHSIKVYLSDAIPGAGAARISQRKIILKKTLKTSEPKALLYSIFFHELQHILDSDANLFHNYYYPTDNNIVRKIGLKAERFTDKRAKLHMKKLFPALKFSWGYATKASVYWYRRVFLDRHFPRT